MTVKSTCAALSGRCAPCSQSRTVPSGRWKRAANCACVSFSFWRKARTVGTRRARASCAFVAGRASGSDSAAWCRCSSLIASKARQSVCGGLFGLSLNFVILPFFMRLRSSRGYDADDRIPHRVSDKEHAAVDHTDRIESQLMGSVEIIELDYIRVQEHPGGRSKVDAVLLPVGVFLGGVPFEVRWEERRVGKECRSRWSPYH